MNEPAIDKKIGMRRRSSKKSGKVNAVKGSSKVFDKSPTKKTAKREEHTK